VKGTTYSENGVGFDFLVAEPIGRFWNEHAYEFRHSPLWSMRPGWGWGALGNFGHTGVTARLARQLKTPNPHDKRLALEIPDLIQPGIDYIDLEICLFVKRKESQDAIIG
jgi:hypothetical protein